VAGAIFSTAERLLFEADLELIRRVVRARWQDGRRSIAAELCRLWAWLAPDGTPRLQPCEHLLIELAQSGKVALPPVPARPPRYHPKVPQMPPCYLDTSSLQARLAELGPLRLELAQRGDTEDLCDYLIARYHPLGHRRVIGEHLKYLAWFGNRPVAALLWGRPALKLAARDRFIGWDPAEPRRWLDRIACNYRFLVLPWVRIRGAASTILAASARRLGGDWQRAFSRRLEWLETFVDPRRFSATSYLAANWIPVGLTRGCGRRGPRYHFHGHQKLILLYPLRRADRRRLCRSPPSLVPLPAVRSVREERPSPASNWKPRSRLGGESMIAVAQAPSTADPVWDLEAGDVKALAKGLVGYHALFRDVFPRREMWEHVHDYALGLFSPIDRRNVENLAEDGPREIPARTLQNFMTTSPWSDQPVRIRHQLLVAESMGHPEGILVVDSSEFPKKGSESAGGARQYCGNTGKGDNCQSGSFPPSAGGAGAEIVAPRLYLPESWFTAHQRSERWKRCHIAPDLLFETKPDLGLEMVSAICERGQLPVRWVLADSLFGRNHAFLDGIPPRYWYFCEVLSNTLVWRRRPRTRLAIIGGKLVRRLRPRQRRPTSVQDLVAQGHLDWTQATIREGAKGPILAEMARARVVEVRDKLPGKSVWLFVERRLDTGEVKFYLSSAPATTPFHAMLRVATARWPIETCFEEAKDRLGMDEYELRSFTGWHHHMTLVMLAQHFLHRSRLSLKKKPPR